MGMARYCLLALLAISLISCSSTKNKIKDMLKSPISERQSTLKKSKSFAIKWVKNIDPVYASGNLPLALHSPLIHKGILFAGTGKGQMRAYEISNGRIIWETQDNGQYHQRPVIFGDQVIYGTIEGRIYSRHYLTGKLNFEIDLDSSIESSGVLASGRLFFQLRNHKVFALDAKTGKILWAYRRSVPYLTTIQRVSPPLVVKNKLYVGFADGAVAAFNIEDGNLLWEQKLSTALKFLDVDSRPVLFKDSLLVGSLAGSLTLLDRKTGAIRKSFPYSISRSPIVTEDRIYLSTTSGEIVVLNHEFKELNKKSISDRPLGDFLFSSLNS